MRVLQCSGAWLTEVHVRVCSGVQGLPCSLLEELLLATFRLRLHNSPPPVLSPYGDTSLLQRTCPSHLRQSNPWSRSD